MGAPPSSTLGGTPAKKGGKKRSPKTPLCSQRRFLLLFFAQAFLVCMYLTPPHLVTTKSSREAAAAAQLRGATSGGADVAKKGIVADVAGSTVEDPEVQLQRRRRGTWRKLRGGIRKRPPGTKPATSAGTTKPSLASVNTTTAKSPRAAQDLSGNATSTTSSTGTTEGDPIPEDLATTSQPLARKPGISLNGSSDAASAHSTGLDSTVGNRIGGAGAEAEGGASAGAGEGGALRLTGEQAQFGKQRQGRAMQNVQEHQREDSSADTSRSSSSIGGTPSSLPLRAVHRQATRGVRQFHLKGEDLEEQRRGAQGSAQARDVFALQSSSHLKAGSLLHEQTQGDTHELGRKALTQQVEDTAEGTGHHATQGSTQASGSHSTAQLARRRLTHWVSSSSPPQPWPPQNPISLRFKALNQQPPRNREAHPVLAADKVVLVLYVHKRAGYLQRALEGLAKMEGVNETLLIVRYKATAVHCGCQQARGRERRQPRRKCPALCSLYCILLLYCILVTSCNSCSDHRQHRSVPCFQALAFTSEANPRLLLLSPFPVRSLSCISFLLSLVCVLMRSHDGQYPEVEALVQGITFCQVKQIHAPYSPHIFRSSFPGPSPEDCRGYAAPNAAPSGCWGQADHYGNFREPNKTAIKVRAHCSLVDTLWCIPWHTP